MQTAKHTRYDDRLRLVYENDKIYKKLNIGLSSPSDHRPSTPIKLLSLAMKPLTHLKTLSLALVSLSAAQSVTRPPTTRPTTSTALTCGEWFFPFPQCAVRTLHVIVTPGIFKCPAANLFSQDNCWWTAAATFDCAERDYRCFCPHSRRIFEIVEQTSCLAPECQWGSGGRGGAEEWEIRLRQSTFCECEAQRWSTRPQTRTSTRA